MRQTELLLQTTKNQEREFLELLEQNKARIMRLCYVYTSTRQNREDLFQEICLHIWKSLPTFRGESHVSTWVYRIALNVAQRYSHSQRRHILPADSTRWVEEIAVEDHATAEYIEYLRHCIAQLNEADKTLMLLYLEEYPYKEIATITGLTETNVGVKLSRLKHKVISCTKTMARIGEKPENITQGTIS